MVATTDSVQRRSLPAQKLEALGVGIVYLFGSYAEGVAGPTSDIDIGVVFCDGSPVTRNTSPFYAALYDIFVDCFDMSNFRTIDIVFLQRASLELRFDAITHGVVLYEISSEFRLEFEEHTAALYRDFQPVLRQFNRTILERV